MLANQFLPIKTGEKRIQRDTAEVLFTNSYVASLGKDDKIDFGKVSEDLADPEILERAKRVEKVARPISAGLVGVLATATAVVGFNIVKGFPEGTYDLGFATIRTGEDAEKQPPFCSSVEDSYLRNGYSMKLLGDLDELQSILPIDDSCSRSNEVYIFSNSD